MQSSSARRLPTLFFLFITACFLIGCGDSGTQNQQNSDSPSAVPEHKVPFSIVSGSENMALAPILEKFASNNGMNLSIEYMGSVDISREIAKGKGNKFDAVWPASSLWISLGDKSSVVKHARSIMRSPVVFAVKKSVANKLEWIGKEVTVTDILKVLEEKKIRFAMTSATQSNSGTSAFFGFLSAFAGSPEVLTIDNLNSADVADQIKRFLRTVDRSSGSSGWLKDMLAENYLYFDGMINYESMVIEMNKTLGQGQDPLYAIYPAGGVTIADSPLGYIDHADSQKEEMFLKLQEWLLSDSVQKSLQQQGRRTGIVGMAVTKADKAIFNPEWGIDLERIITPVTIPSGDVVSEALNLYQTAFRKPSLTAYVLDYSGSMQGNGEKQLKKAMRTLLDQNIAKEFLLQSSSEDTTYVIPFNSNPVASWKVEGNDPAALDELLNRVESLTPSGGTNMYKAAEVAIKLIKNDAESGKYHTSIIVMSDGASEGRFSDFEKNLS
ncbi:MAG: VWA domain-containing protein, partial [Desulfamplus sp.]|nr:VWA domain-containing protein [Desulfamplus sp.]